MRKSSLGRRSSTHIPVRVPSFGGNTTGQRTCSGKKSSGSLLKPGFSQPQRYRRSQSEERESYGGRSTYSRANVNAMTPITPRRPSSVHSNLPTGSVIRGPRNQMTSTDSNRRMSSFGGTKRKDMRPIGEKSFQQTAQTKVQQYFDLYAPDIIGPGNNVRPMNTKLFVDMLDHLLKNLDSRTVITKSNYMDEIPPLLKKLGYRSKIDRSWLMTVNTPHSWQHVIALLSWLVELKEIIDVTDDFEMMYPEFEEAGEDNNYEEEENYIKIDKEMIFYLKKSYQMRSHHTAERLAEILTNMDDEFIEKQIKELKCTDEDFETLQRENDLIQEEVDSEMQRKNLDMEELEKLQAKTKAVLDDCQTLEEFIKKSQHFIDTIDVKLDTMEKEVMVKKATLAKKKEDLQRIQDKVNNQQISAEENEKLNKEKHELQRMINFHENAIREYENSAFSVDLKLVEDQRKLEGLVLEYNKLVAEKVIVEPRLKDVELKLQFLTKPDDTTLKTVDANLKMLKEEFKNSINQLELKKQELEDILRTATRDVEETREDISKETTLLEGVEYDYEKHQELANKETQKLKDDLSHYQKITKGISEDLAQFDEAKLKEKKIQLKKLQHDHMLVQKRSKQLFDGLRCMAEETTAQIGPTVANFTQEVEKFEKNHLL